MYVHTIHPLRHHTHSTFISTNNPTLQHTPQDEGDQALYDTIDDTVTNLIMILCSALKMKAIHLSDKGINGTKLVGLLCITTPIVRSCKT